MSVWRHVASSIFKTTLIPLSHSVWKSGRKIKQWIKGEKETDWVKVEIPNLAGDRDIEWSWVAGNLPSGPGLGLDFGPGSSFISLIAARKSFRMMAVDMEPCPWLYEHDGITYIQGDLLKLSIPENHFDLIVNCSTVEHVGLAGRFSVTQSDSDSDLRIMTVLRRWMKPDAVMLLTIPMGQDAVFVPIHRVYGCKRLPKLLEGYRIEKEEFWVKNKGNRWIQSSKDQALDFKSSTKSENPFQNIYALGCFVLKRA